VVKWFNDEMVRLSKSPAIKKIVVRIYFKPDAALGAWAGRLWSFAAGQLFLRTENLSGKPGCHGVRRAGNRATRFRPPARVEMEFGGEKFKEQFHQAHQGDAVGAVRARVQPVAEAEKTANAGGGAEFSLALTPFA